MTTLHSIVNTIGMTSRKRANHRTRPTDRTTTAQYSMLRTLTVLVQGISERTWMYRYRTLCGEGLTKLLRSTCVCLDSICDSFHKSKYLSFLFFCKRILTSQLTILQNLKQFKLVNLYLQGFKDWSCGHWRAYLMYQVNKSTNMHFRQP